MTTPRLVATDLDGTLLRSDGSLSSRSRRALRAVEAKGIETVLVTARPPRWLHDLADVVGGAGTAICANGAFVYHVASREVLACTAIDGDVVAEVVADLRRELPGIGFAAERITGLAAEDGFAALHQHPEGWVRAAAIEDLAEAPGKLLARAPAMDDLAFVEAVTDIVGDRLIVAYSGAGGLAEMSAPGVTKAVALAARCAALGIDAAGVWAFGDMPNDLPMLEWAGVSHAVANAHPDVLTAADRVVPSNDDDGVAATLEPLLDS
ncbi:HAD family hydrolase [Janibacter sp. G56]|uniref:HAD family hydrolase n=1 Tax=Janibacter sp. G56 TaxID=3418717 RepID=UPI003D039CB1